MAALVHMKFLPKIYLAAGFVKIQMSVFSFLKYAKIDLMKSIFSKIRIAKGIMFIAAREIWEEPTSTASRFTLTN